MPETTFRLLDWFAPPEVGRDGEFRLFGVPGGAAAGTLVFCEDVHHLELAIADSAVTAVIVPPALAPAAHDGRAGIVVAETPRTAFWQLFDRMSRQGLMRPAVEPGRGVRCRIHPSAIIADHCSIGDEVEIGPRAVVEDHAVIGSGCFIGPGAIIGAEGLQAYRDAGRPRFVRHAGGVELGEGVSVLAQAVVSKAVFPSFTVVGAGTHLSLLSSVGHESRIGRNCLIAGNVLIGGSVTVGDDVVIGPSATLKDGVKVGAGARIRIGSVVVADVPARGDVSGNFALAHTRHLRRYARSSSRDDA